MKVFIPSHLACVRGVVHDVDSSLSSSEVLEFFSPASVTSVYRFTKFVDGARQTTDSVIATFSGLSRPSAIKTWPLIYRADPFIRRLSQWRKGWKFGHV